MSCSRQSEASALDKEETLECLHLCRRGPKEIENASFKYLCICGLDLSADQTGLVFPTPVFPGSCETFTDV